MEKIRYYFERIYPYLGATVITGIMAWKKIVFVEDVNMESALEGVNTTAALIIGFLGAMLPVILGMKNESKFVKYVFEKDSKKLFLRYTKSTIMSGLILVAVTVSLYFRISIPKRIISKLFFSWIFLLVLFLMCTYRSLSNMLNLVFSKDSELKRNYGVRNSANKTAKEIDAENKFNIDI